MKKGIIVKYFLLIMLCCPLFAIANSVPNATEITLSQIIKEKKITLNVSDKTLNEIMLAINKQTKIEYGFQIAEKDRTQKFSLNVVNMPIEDALATLLRGSKFDYKVIDNRIMIVLRPQEKENIAKKKISVSGRVISAESKEPVAGATVMVINSGNGAITDEKGKFILSTDVGQEIEVTFVGMKNVIRKITDSPAEVLIALQKDELTVEDVIVTGYQEISKTRMTGSAETLTSKDIANRGYTSIEEALKGQMAGVSTMNVSGRPGASAEIRIRGINSITGSSDPMWIVDGMPLQGDVPQISLGGTEFQETVLTSGIGNIPPDDIESITVLKDAAATAIYGARAANGVIVIKTKRGAVGRSTISINASYSINEAPKNRLEMMNTREKIEFEKSIYEDFPTVYLGGRVHTLLRRAANSEITSDEVEKEIARLGTINTDWYKEIFNMGHTQNHSATLSGGSETTSYYANLSYLGQKGIVPNNRYESVGGNLKLTHDFNKRLRINFDLRSTIRTDRTDASGINPLNYATFANPYERPYDENGNYEYDRSYSSERSIVRDDYKYNFNALREMNENTSNSKYLSTGITLKLEYKIFNGLMFSTMGTLSNTNTTTKQEIMPGTYASSVGAWLNGLYTEGEVPSSLNNGRMNESTSRNSSWTVRNQLEFAKGFNGEKHYVSVFLGQEVSSSMNYGYSSMIPEWNPIYGIASYPDISGITVPSGLGISSFGSHSESQDRSVSMFINGSYSYEDRYVISASARLDGADIIGTANRFHPLWNVSGKWNLHKEKFMSGVTFINQFAIRGSYGFTGSIDRNVLQFSTTEKTKNYTYDGEPIMNRYNPASPSIKWQRKEDRNIGFDASLFNYRVNIVANYYNNDTRNVIGTDYVAASSGYQKILANISSLNNEGWELSLKTVNIRTKNFTWSTSFSLAKNTNKVTATEYKSIDDVPPGAIMNANYLNNLYIEGGAVGAIYGYEWAGVDPLDGGTLVYVDDTDSEGNRIGNVYKDGRYVVNLDRDKTTETILAGRKYLGQKYPPITGGFNTQFNYKRFSLSANFSLYTGHIISSYQTIFSNQSVSGAANNVIREEANRWRRPGDNTNIAKYSTSNTAKTINFFDKNFEKGNYLKCNNISFGYNLEQSVCNKLHLERIRVNFNMQNPFTITNYRGADPENRGAFGYPVAKIYNFSISIGI